MSFNPLPPLWGGRTVGAVYNRQPIFVSIRSRLCGAGEHPDLILVFILRQFQSAPAFVGRENGGIGNYMLYSQLFQSAPAFVGRENIQCTFNKRCSHVSIRSRLCGAGERGSTHCQRLGCQVSIRSRLCGAGEQSMADNGMVHDRFQSAPAFVGRENGGSARVARPHPCFNPLPPLWGGRTHALRFRSMCKFCFNPLPPLWGGRTVPHAGADCGADVSIRSRLCGAGERPVGNMLSCLGLFQYMRETWRLTIFEHGGVVSL